MKQSCKEAEAHRLLRKIAEPLSVTQGFVIAGAAVGLLLGVCEAASLRWRLHLFTAAGPDSGHLIWLLAPLLDLLTFGFIGLTLGLAAAKWGDRAESGTPTVLASLGFGIAGAFAVCIPLLNDSRLAEHRVGIRMLIGLAGGFGAFAISYQALKSRRPRVTAPRENHRRFLSGLLRGIIPLITASLIAALAVSWRGGLTSFDPPGASPPGTPHGPNIVLISLDATVADHLSCYGYSRPTTPNLDRLASHGVLFENAIAPSSWTLPSFASIFTGQFPHEHGADITLLLAGRLFTLAEMLDSQGYETSGFNANWMYGEASSGTGQGFKVYEDGSSTFRQNFALTLVARVLHKAVYYPFIRPVFLEQRNAQEVNQEVYRWFQHRTPRPFFLFINYFDTHSPYLAPSPYDHRFGRLPYRVVRRLQPVINTPRVPEAASREERGSVVAGYDNSLAYLDSKVSELLRFLAGTPEWANTVVIVTADHGESFGEHGYYGHGWGLYRELLHVPLIISGPGVPQGLRISNVVATRALAATVLDFAGRGEMYPGAYSLRRFWTPGKNSQAGPNSVVSEMHYAPWPGAPIEALVSVTTPEWHYIRGTQGQNMLFHWAQDPHEEINLSASALQGEVVHALQEMLRDRLHITRQPWMDADYPRIFALLGSTIDRQSFTEGSRQQVETKRLNQEEKRLLESLPYQ